MPTSAQAVVPLLQVSHLRTHFFTDAGVVKAVEDVSFALNAEETLAVVGESGSGKSVTSLSIMGSDPESSGTHRRRRDPVPNARRARWSIWRNFRSKALRKLRGRDIAMIFQEPMTSLNPVFTVGDQIAEAAALHLGMNRARGDEARTGNAGARGDSRRRDSGSTNIRISCPAGCGSG